MCRRALAILTLVIGSAGAFAQNESGSALQGIDRLYLVAPVMRMDFADQVVTFLDLAETAACVTSRT